VLKNRNPGLGNLSAELYAPRALFVGKIARSASHSAAVGSRNPLGHGLFVPPTPCHKLSFFGARQSDGETELVIKFEFPGESV
jgi:hypothetical protein